MIICRCMCLNCVDALNECEKAVKGSKVVVLGFSYKENVGDARESPAVGIVEGLRKFGVEVYGGIHCLVGVRLRGLVRGLWITDHILPIAICMDGAR